MREIISVRRFAAVMMDKKKASVKEAF